MNKYKIYGNLNSCLPPKDFTIDTKNELEEDVTRKMTNPQQFDTNALLKILEEKNSISGEDEEDEEEEINLLATNEYKEEKVKAYFQFLFAKERKSNILYFNF